MVELNELLKEQQELKRKKREIDERIKELKELEKGYEYGGIKISFGEYHGKTGYKLSCIEQSERSNVAWKTLVFCESKSEMVDRIDGILDSLYHIKQEIYEVD